MAEEKEPSGRGAPDGQENRVLYADGNASRYGGLIFAGVVLGLILLAIAADLLL